MLRQNIAAGSAAGLLLAALAVMAQQQPSTSQQQPSTSQLQAKHALEEANKKVAIAFFRPGITAQERAAMMDPGYVQHNPVFARFAQINGVSGSAAFEAYVKAAQASRAPGPAPPAATGNADPTYKVLADNNYVVVVARHNLPDPQNAGKTYESFSFELWRLKNGKLAEHWDASTIPVPVPAVLEHPQAQ